MSFLAKRKISVTVIVMFHLISFAAQAKDNIISEYNANCIRFHFMPDKKDKKSELMEIVKSAKSYAVRRKSANEALFQTIHAQEYPKDEKELKAMLGLKDKSAFYKEKKVIRAPQGYAPYVANVEGFEDVLQRKSDMVFLSVLNAKTAMAMGVGYQDCAIQKPLEYAYHIEYTLLDGRKVRYPEQSFRVFYEPRKLPAPRIDHLEPLENGAKAHFHVLPDAGKSEFTAIGYNVYIREEKEGKPVKANDVLLVPGAVKTAVHDLLHLRPGGVYYFTVRAVSFGGLESEDSEKVEFQVRSLKAPSPIKRVDVEPVQGGMKIRWSAPGEKDVVGYNVYAAAGDLPQHKFRKINTVLIPATLLEYIDTMKNLPEKRYVYRVSAVNKWGNEGHMSSAGFFDYVDKEPPSTPEQLVADSLPTGVRLKWRYSGNTKKLRGYLVYRNSTISEDAQPLDKTVRSGETEYLDKTARPGVGYWYTVRALSKAGTFSAYPPPVFQKAKDVRLPHPPVEAGYIRDSNNVFLHWKKPGDDNLTGYHIYIRTPNGIKKLSETVIPKENLKFVIPRKALAEKNEFLLSSVNADGKESQTKTKLTVDLSDYQMFPAEGILPTHLRGGIHFRWQGEPQIDNIDYFLFRKRVDEEKYHLVKKIAGKSLVVQDTPPAKADYEYFLSKKHRKSGEKFNSRIFLLSHK